MYVPSAFAPPSIASMLDIIERYSFAVLVSGGGETLEASHLPLLLDRDAGPNGTLVGHMARANPQWRSASGHNVLAIFSGPHAYISPRWYEAAGTVPTWNYIAVHATGRLEPIDDAAEVEALLRRTTAHYEANQPEPWQLDEPAEFVAGLARQVVAFRIPIDRLEGKWKLNQNHPAERRAKVVAGLRARPDNDSHEIAQWMETLDAE